ncbi:PIN domain-containing protein [Methylobacterium radiotolerans]|uniref:PIN domain-containing protein n=1 Tax=Methylobacterium radiotolerans TaxID=31998 RepID=UPI0009785AEF|nr:PIN domain-containing protein [Methylobacterium radiotolerans]
MDTYLLDTNLVSVLYDNGRPNRAAVCQAVAALPTEAAKLVSVVTTGELRFGLALARAAGRPLTHIEACLAKAETHPLAEITRHTADAYASVKSRVALGRIDIMKRIPRWVDAWSDRVTDQLLQIDGNDLWLAAQAIERNYVVVTSDRDFTQVIAPEVPELRVLLV